MAVGFSSCCWAETTAASNPMATYTASMILFNEIAEVIFLSIIILIFLGIVATVIPVFLSGDEWRLNGDEEGFPRQ